MKLWPFSKKSATPYSAPYFAQLLAAAFGAGGSTKSGATVTVETALQVSVVLACVRVIAEGVAQVPFQVMQEIDGGPGGAGVSRLPAKNHALYDVLHRKPNRWQSSFGLRETMVMHAVLVGDAYAYKNRVGADRHIKELVVIPPSRCKAEATEFGDLTYRVSGKDGSVRNIAAEDMWHLRGPSWDGLVGMNILNYAREAIGLAMAAEETQANLHAKGVRTSGVYSVEGALNKEQHASLTEWIATNFGGAAASGTPMVLDRGAKWQPMSMTGVDAQHLETRKHQVEEICRQLRVMPIMVMQADKAATYASSENMFIAHVVHTLAPWYERVEQSADCQLLSDKDRAEGYYTFLNPAGLLRGALKDVAEYIYKLVAIGAMTRNEGRRMLDLNPIEGLDEPLTPMNMITSSINDPNSQKEPANGP